MGPLGERSDQQEVRAERPAVSEGQSRVTRSLAGERTRNVAFHMPGSHQHQRHGDDVAMPGADQVRCRRRDRWWRELDEPANDVNAA